MHIIETMRYFFTKRLCLTRRVGSKLLKGYGEKTFSKTQIAMRDIKKIKMKDVTPLQDPEMKAVRGGYYGGGSGYNNGSGGFFPPIGGGSGIGGYCCEWYCTTDASGSKETGDLGQGHSTDECWSQAEAAGTFPDYGIWIYSSC